MGTRGIYGFRKNNEDKLTYNHFDSYPDYLGIAVVDFCKTTNLQKLNDIYDRIVLIDSNKKPTAEQITDCLKWANLEVSEQSSNDWYCLLRKAQGDLTAYTSGLKYMSKDNDFIKDSLFCEFGYIINLDNNKLEFWKGFQKEPQKNNRYGAKQENGFYPCKLAQTFPLNNIPENIIGIMNEIE
jgi:hypothetical protein